MSSAPTGLAHAVRELMDSIGGDPETGTEVVVGLLSYTCVLGPGELMRIAPELQELESAAGSHWWSDSEWEEHRPDLEAIASKDASARADVCAHLIALLDQLTEDGRFAVSAEDAARLTDEYRSHAGREAKRRTVVAIHGINQRKGPDLQRDSWTSLLSDGLERLGDHPELGGEAVAVPYYGDLIADWSSGDAHPVAELLSRMAGVDIHPSVAPGGLKQVALKVAGDVVSARGHARSVSGSTIAADLVAVSHESDLDAKAGRAGVSRLVASLTGTGTAAFVQILREVDRYLHDLSFRKAVQKRVSDSVTTPPDIVIGHSLGSVVALDWVLSQGRDLDALVTLGSPLWMPVVVDSLLSFHSGRRKVTIGQWVNAFDPRDPVAGGAGLRQTWGHGLVTDVRADTADRILHHGIRGYVDHPAVALVMRGTPVSLPALASVPQL